MRKIAVQLTPEQRQEIIRRAGAVNLNGEWAETYRAIAKSYNIVLQAVTLIARQAGLPPRVGRTGRPRIRPVIKRTPREPKLSPPAPAPQPVRQMYRDLVKKVGAVEARRIMEDHRRVRGS